MDHNSVATGTIVALTALGALIFVLGYAVGRLWTIYKAWSGKSKKGGRKC